MKTGFRIILTAAAASAVAVSCKNEIEFDACGQIDAVQITVSAEAGGRILSLGIEEGDRLAGGEVIGAIDSVQTYLQVCELEERISGMNSKLIDVARQSEPNVAQLAGLRNDLARYSKLLEDNAASRKQVEDLEDKIAVLEAQIAAQKQSWERSNKSVLSEIATAGIQLEQRRDQLRRCRIVAPSNGTVLTKYAEEGESVTAGKALFKMADMDRVYVRAYFTTGQLAGLSIGDELTVIPDDGTKSPKKYTGRLTWISEQAEFTPKNIQTRDERADLVYAVKVSVPNDGSLRLGMYAYVVK
ncbi:MAG: HlyD family secretion protein [Candidatus Cryptobacteroides sp.]